MSLKYSMEIDRILKNIKRKLFDIDPLLSLEYLNWLDKKTNYFRQSVFKLGYGPQPDDIKRGDIVWVEFGVNVGSELSDMSTKGHYALVWLIDLGNVVVIPLTSRPSDSSPLTIELGVIEELNSENTNQTSYLKLDAIRSVSKRRIGRMPSKDGGKITMDADKIELVKKHIYEYLIKDYSNEIEENKLSVLTFVAEDLYDSDYSERHISNWFIVSDIVK